MGDYIREAYYVLYTHVESSRVYGNAEVVYGVYAEWDRAGEQSKTVTTKFIFTMLA